MVGNGLTVMLIIAVSLQPLVVPVTEYMVVSVGLTVIEAVVSLVLHKYVSAPAAVSVVELPSQIVVLLAWMLTVGKG
jgi:hypothetical protein